MREINDKYIMALDRFGFGLFRTKSGCNIYHPTPTGTFLINFNGDNFVEMLIGYAETFDPNTYVSLQIKSHRNVKDIGEMIKDAKEIQILLLKVALEFVKINKESTMVACDDTKNA